MATGSTNGNETARLDELYRYAILDTPPEDLFDEITAIAAQACEVPIALISLVDRHRQWFKSKVGLAASQTAREDAFCALTIEGTEPLVIEDAAADPRFADNPLVKGEPYIRFYTGMPLRTPRGLALGSLSVIDRRPRILTAEQIRILKLLAAQVAQQLELHLIAETLRRQSRLLDETQRMAEIGGWQLDLNTSVLTWTDATYRLHGLDPESYSPSVDSAIAMYTPESAARVRRAVEAAIQTGTAYDLELELIRADGLRRWVRTTGMRENEPGRRRLFGALQDITERRALEQEIMLIAQREQARIGADLHDGLGQELTGIAFLLHALKSKIAAKKASVGADVRELEKLVRKAIGTCHLLAHGMSPTGIERRGLVAALQRHAAQIEKIHHVQVTIKPSDAHVMADGFAADQLYRIAQEAITNAIKHGGAQHILVRVEATPEQTTVSISDDGRWVNRAADADGMGLRIMRYRARLMGASLEIQPAGDGDTIVRCQVPHALLAKDPHALNRPRPHPAPH